ncbi:TRAP transporter large permease subunit [Aliihoeflea aestuarii]|jgi:C4-dicarboxylate transporter, DctM subunit|uniref:TRAP transporter large permease n=1 Tax=Aliihoeflea aestuarii TaxID=453840 RepID=UPI002092459D|nr:TRAP transporter large permease [Aliihoeflea aestuarii]MCO6391801.1 TRAP transporter large permease subunit [Aliihoeflea aestuarii]
MAVVLICGFLLLLILNVPISFALMIASLAAILYGDIPPMLVGQRMTAAIDSFILLAVPFFLLAGHLMARSGIARDIMNLANAVLGWLRGGLAHASIGAGTLMGGMTGSAVAEASSIGGAVIPEMVRKGYSPAFAAAVVASGSLISILIPPSVPLIIFGVVTGVSVSRLFVAGLIPGLLVAVVLLVVVWLMAIRNNYPRGDTPSRKTILKALRASLWGLFLPVVIIGSIRYGIATPTEASVLAVLYALFVGLVVYRSIRLRDLPSIISDAAITTGIVMMLIAGATLYGLIITREQLPQQAAAFMLTITSDPQMLLLLIVAIYLIGGMVLDLGAAIIIFVPILWPITQQVGIDPMQFGIVTVLGLGIGLITPPVGASLFVACGIARCQILLGSRAVLPFIGGLLALLLAIVFFPGIATWLPSRM